MTGMYTKFPLFNLHFPESEKAIKYKIVFLDTVFLLAGVVALALGFYRIRISLALGMIDFVFAALNFTLLIYSAGTGKKRTSSPPLRWCFRSCCSFRYTCWRQETRRA